MKGQTSQTALDAFQELATSDALALLSVHERIVDGCRELIVLKFRDVMLSLGADADTDTIEVRCQDSDSLDLSGLDRVDAQQPWAEVIGKDFGWGWVTVNQQGYQDGVLLSFGGLDPSVLLSVTASAIGIYSIRR
jgi:hypothetical protein